MDKLITILSILFFTIGCKKGTIPVLTTIAVTNISPATAISGGNISSDGGAAVTGHGICWSISLNPTTLDNKISSGSGEKTFTNNITGLNAVTTYFVRAYATNSIGTGYGQQIQFTTSDDFTGQHGTVRDIDGTFHPTIGIGGQIWMTENLKTTKFNDGTSIPLITDNTLWTSATTFGYCWYDNNEASNKATYGALYNWYAVSTGKLCPTGWHVPTDAEWYTMAIYLGGVADAAGKLKERGTTHWMSPNSDATNETGFTALPGGWRDNSFLNLGYIGFWWSSTELNASQSVSISLVNFTLSNVYIGTSIKGMGCSVRCVKD